MLDDLVGRFSDGALILFLSLVVEGFVGGWRRAAPDSAALIERLAAPFERRLNRQNRAESVRRRRGLFVAAAIVVAAIVAGWLALEATRLFTAGWLVQVAIVALLISQRGAYRAGEAVARALEQADLPAARAALRRGSGVAEQSAGDAAPARRAVEILFQDFAQRVVAPSLWYLLLGLPGLFASCTARALRASLGRGDKRLEAFGRGARLVDAVLNFAPARLAGAAIAAAATFTPTANPAGAWRVLGKHGAARHEFESAPSEAAAAGALMLMLGGPRWRDGELVDDPWLGEGRLRAGAADVRRGLLLFAVTCLLHAACAGALAVLARGAGF